MSDGGLVVEGRKSKTRSVVRMTTAIWMDCTKLDVLLNAITLLPKLKAGMLAVIFQDWGSNAKGRGTSCVPIMRALIQNIECLPTTRTCMQNEKGSWRLRMWIKHLEALECLNEQSKSSSE